MTIEDIAELQHRTNANFIAPKFPPESLQIVGVSGTRDPGSEPEFVFDLDYPRITAIADPQPGGVFGRVLDKPASAEFPTGPSISYRLVGAALSEHGNIGVWPNVTDDSPVIVEPK